MKKTGLNGYVYDVTLDYDASAVDNIFDITFISIWWKRIIWYKNV